MGYSSYGYGDITPINHPLIERNDYFSEVLNE